MSTWVKITELVNIGGNLSYNTLIPVVDMNGTPTTKKALVQNLGNLILNNAGNGFPAASAANTAITVTANAQPNITSLGTLSTLIVNGNTNTCNVFALDTVTSTSGEFANLVATGNITLAANITVGGGNPVPSTDSTIAFKIPVTINGNTYYIALTSGA